MKKQIHFAAPVIINPVDIVSITIIGMGGTGTRLIQELVRMNIMLLKLGHIGLHVTVMDGDKISSSNIGRQFYYKEDIGEFKAETITKRINRNFGFNWFSINKNFYYHANLMSNNLMYSNIVVSCVDVIEPRIQLNNLLKKVSSDGYHDSDETFYSIDCGNSFNQGQVICGTVKNIKQPIMKNLITVPKLKGIFEIFNTETIEKAKEGEDQQASCSTFEALQRQDPFINSMIATLAARIIWNLIKEHQLTEHGYFVNLEESTPIISLKV